MNGYFFASIVIDQIDTYDRKDSILYEWVNHWFDYLVNFIIILHELVMSKFAAVIKSAKKGDTQKVIQIL